MKRIFFIFIFFFFAAPALFGQRLTIAVAANAQFVMKALQAEYFKSTGKKLELIISSSGKLTAQIMHGAPYDLFLSADMQFPEQLYRQGLALSSPQVYALGSLIVCSNSNIVAEGDWPKHLLSPTVNKIAIANSALAPYGRAAEETLTHLGLLEKLKKKLVYGESIAQVNTYIASGAVQIGFTTEAFAIEKGSTPNLYWTRVDPSYYAPIKQGVVLLKYAKRHQTEAQHFYNYLFSEKARRIFEQYGYRLNN